MEQEENQYQGEELDLEQFNNKKIMKDIEEEDVKPILWEDTDVNEIKKGLYKKEFEFGAKISKGMDQQLPVQQQ